MAKGHLPGVTIHVNSYEFVILKYSESLNGIMFLLGNHNLEQSTCLPLQVRMKATRLFKVAGGLMSISLYIYAKTS